jgi:hypothetical protein
MEKTISDWLKEQQEADAHKDALHLMTPIIEALERRSIKAEFVELDKEVGKQGKVKKIAFIKVIVKENKNLFFTNYFGKSWRGWVEGEQGPIADYSTDLSTKRFNSEVVADAIINSVAMEKRALLRNGSEKEIL